MSCLHQQAGTISVEMGVFFPVFTQCLYPVRSVNGNAMKSFMAQQTRRHDLLFRIMIFF